MRKTISSLVFKEGPEANKSLIIQLRQRPERLLNPSDEKPLAKVMSDDISKSNIIPSKNNNIMNNLYNELSIAHQP